MPTAHIDGREKAKEKKEKRGDVFEPPYNPNLYVGELQDEEEGAEYVVLVSRLVRHLMILREHCERRNRRCTVPLPDGFFFIAQQVLCRRGTFSPGHQRCVCSLIVLRTQRSWRIIVRFLPMWFFPS